ncbi:MAG: hypothetical protein OHK0023_22820 [Anaerolineae bacterium]
MQRLVVTLLTLLTPPLLMLVGVRLLMTDAYLYFEYTKSDFPADIYGFSTDDRLKYAPYAVQFLVYNAPLQFLADLRFSDGTALYNERELSHMRDVQIVVNAAMIALAALIIIFVVLGSILSRSAAGRKRWRQGLRGGALLTLGILAALVTYIVLDWEHFFDAFHALFFEDGTWRFYMDDTLIRLFPPRFWQDAAVTVGIFAALGALALLWLTGRWSKHAKSAL